MSKLADEKQALVLADEHIATAKRNISEQEHRVAAFEAEDHEGASQARDLLATMRQTLEGFLDHRAMILQEIARLEAEAG